MTRLSGVNYILFEKIIVCDIILFCFYGFILQFMYSLYNHMYIDKSSVFTIISTFINYNCIVYLLCIIPFILEPLLSDTKKTPEPLVYFGFFSLIIGLILLRKNCDLLIHISFSPNRQLFTAILIWCCLWSWDDEQNSFFGETMWCPIQFYILSILDLGALLSCGWWNVTQVSIASW